MRVERRQLSGVAHAGQQAVMLEQLHETRGRLGELVVGPRLLVVRAVRVRRLARRLHLGRIEDDDAGAMDVVGGRLQPHRRAHVAERSDQLAVLCVGSRLRQIQCDVLEACADHIRPLLQLLLELRVEGPALQIGRFRLSASLALGLLRGGRRRL